MNANGVLGGSRMFRMTERERVGIIIGIDRIVGLRANSGPIIKLED